MTNAFSDIMEFVNAIKATGEFVMELGKAIDETTKKIINSGEKIGGSWMEINDIAYKTARTMGLSGEAAKAYNKSLIDSTKALATQFGLTHKELDEFQKSYSESIGRNVQLTKDQLRNMATLSKLIDSTTAAKLYDEFDKVGVGISRATANVIDLQDKAKAIGVNPSKATKMMADNIKLAASYSFKNGLADIEQMALKAAGLRMDMAAVMKSTEKFDTIEGAISTSANIQMLGGTFAREFSNPMAPLYESWADPKSFQDRILRTIEGKGNYDAKTGAVTFDPLAMQFMKAFAKQMGMSHEELNNIAIASVQNNKVEEELKAAGNWNNWTPMQQEAIKNLSRANFDEEKGQHYVNVRGENGEVERKYLSELTKDQLKIAQDTELTEEQLRGDVQDIKEILKRGEERAKATVSGRELKDAFNLSYTALKAQLQGIYMFPGTDLVRGLGQWIGEQFFEKGGIVEPVRAELGTIVPGNSFKGDKVHARVNSGEMILSHFQQKGLFDLINSLSTKTVSGGLISSLRDSISPVGVNEFNSDRIFGDVFKKISIFSDSLDLLNKSTDNVINSFGLLGSKFNSFGIKDDFDKKKPVIKPLNYSTDSESKEGIKSIYRKTIKDSRSPISTMYSAINDNNAFKRRVINTFAKKAIRDKRTGELSFDPVTSRMINDISHSIGVSPKEIKNATINNNRTVSDSSIGFVPAMERISPHSIGISPRELKDITIKKTIDERSSLFSPTNESNIINKFYGGALQAIKPERGTADQLFGRVSDFFGSAFNKLFGRNDERNDDFVGSITPIESLMRRKYNAGVTPLSLSNNSPIGSIFTNYPKTSPITGDFMKVSPIRNNDSTETSRIGNANINLNISGTIKLEGGGKTAEFDLSKLIDTPEFKRQLSDIITRKINENSNSGKLNKESMRNNMASQYNRSGK